MDKGGKLEMDITEAIKKLNEYAKCGLTYNGGYIVGTYGR